MLLPAHMTFCDFTTALVLNTKHNQPLCTCCHNTTPTHTAWNKLVQTGDYGTLGTGFVFFFFLTVNTKFSDFIQTWQFNWKRLSYFPTITPHHTSKNFVCLWIGLLEYLLGFKICLSCSTEFNKSFNELYLGIRNF